MFSHTRAVFGISETQLQVFPAGKCFVIVLLPRGQLLGVHEQLNELIFTRESQIFCCSECPLETPSPSMFQGRLDFNCVAAGLISFYGNIANWPEQEKMVWKGQERLGRVKGVEGKPRLGESCQQVMKVSCSRPPIAV